MESISSTNITSISAVDLQTKFNDKCYSDWSKSNLISIVTPDGIYILKPQLDIPEGPFQGELIVNPECKFEHQTTYRFWVSFDSMLQSISNKQYMEMFSDPNLMTNISGLSLETYPRRFRMAKWSPLVDHYPRECILAVLTLDSQLIIYAYRQSTWVIISDLSRDYDRVWSQLYINNGGKEVADYESIRANLLSLSFCNICWKESTCGNGPMIIAATIPGDLVIWQFVINGSASEGFQSNLNPFELKIVIRTGIEYITSMQLYEGLLIISSRDGQVILYDLTTHINTFDTVTDKKITKANGTHLGPRTLNIVTIPPTVIIWHKDDVEVSDMYIQSLPSDNFRLVLAKSTNICWSLNQYVKKEDKSAATLSIDNLFSAIDGLDPDLSLHQSPATWLRPAGKGRAILIANDGSFFQIRFDEFSKDATPHFDAVRTGSINLTDMVPRGLCCSSNGHLVTMISSVNYLHDPLKITAPTKVLLMPTLNDKSFLIESLQKFQDDDWLQQEMISSPMDVCDRIDYLRSIFHLLNSTQHYELNRVICQAIKDIEVIQNNTQLVKLKIFGFILMKLTELSNSYMEVAPSYQHLDLDGIVRDVILQHEIESITSSLSDNAKEQKSQLDGMSKEQLLSLNNFVKWIFTHNRTTSSDDKFRLILAHLTKAQLHETCSICGAIVAFTSAKYGACQNQHRFDRCARSLLMIDLQECEMLTCEHCKRSYSAKPIWTTRNLWLCIYCQ